MALSLSNLVRAKSDKPPRIVIYGVPGIGKTSLAAEFPEPIFIQTEEGAGNLELTTFADGPLTSAAEVDEAIELLLTGDHKFRTVVLDSLDWFEPLLWAAVCKRNKWATIEEAGYGRGYIELDADWRYFLGRMNALRDAARHDGVLSRARGDPELLRSRARQLRPLPSAPAQARRGDGDRARRRRWLHELRRHDQEGKGRVQPRRPPRPPAPASGCCTWPSGPPSPRKTASRCPTACCSPAARAMRRWRSTSPATATPRPPPPQPERTDHGKSRRNLRRQRG